jgi:secreted trypsin-like serine protease
MKILAICLVATVAYSHGSPAAPSGLPSTRTSIVGGQEAEPNQFPWQISLQHRNLPIGAFHHICGATIIDSQHIVCAAHCIAGKRASYYKVVAGAHNIHSHDPEATVQERRVEEMWHHENYNSMDITNDVSVLKLDSPLDLNEFVAAIPMATEDPAPGTICINSGWGSTSDNNQQNMPDKLQWVNLPIITRELCKSNYDFVNGVIDDRNICGGDAAGYGACSGDSGGPLVCPVGDSEEYHFVGIVSWGMIPCAGMHHPSVFTDVKFFRDWINQHVAM